MEPVSDSPKNEQRRAKYAQDRDFRRAERKRCKRAMQRLRIVRKHIANQEPLFRLKEVAGMLGVSSARVLNMVEQGVMPEPIIQGGRGDRCFRLADILQGAKSLPMPE